MKRRWTGLAVITLVLLAAVIAPKFWSAPLVGQAMAGAVPGPPTIGSCLSTPTTSSGLATIIMEGFVGNAATGREPSGQAQVKYPSLPVGTCSPTRFGEVVGVLPTRARLSLSAEPGGGFTNPNLTACDAVAADYLGFPDAQASFGWIPEFSLGVALLAPSPVQVTAGQHWLACLGYVVDPAGHTVNLTASVRAAVHTGAGRDLVGRCDVGESWNSGTPPTSCARPHRTEVFGTIRSSSPSSTRETLDRTCRQWIEKLTGLADVTAGGVLLVLTPVYSTGSTLDTRTPLAAGSQGYCGIETSGVRQLTGSLLGLGHRPLPWA